MRRKRLCMMIAVMLLLSMALTIVVASGAEARVVNYCDATFKAKDSNTAIAKVTGMSTGNPEFITSKITLQSATKGYTNFTNASNVNPESKTVEALSIFHTCEFPISNTKDYRIMIQLTDSINGIEVTRTYYTNLTY